MLNTTKNPVQIGWIDYSSEHRRKVMTVHSRGSPMNSSEIEEELVPFTPSLLSKAFRGDYNFRS